MNQKKLKIILTIFIIILFSIVVFCNLWLLYTKNIFYKTGDWNKYKNNPVLGDGYTGSVFDPYVMIDSDGTYRMYVSWRRKGAIAVTTSKDGITWEKYSQNPILKANEDKKAMDRYKVGGCDVHKISNNLYIMFYIGYTDIDTARIFVAKSQDGVNWERTGQPIIVPEHGKFDMEACYKPSAIFDDKNNRWMLWYNGRTAEKEYIGLAICNKKEI